jgi:PAS domain S-box-containing protein
MESARIMVVEDEGIIAQDIKNCLENLGYEVPEVVFTGHDAIQKAEELHPDLVLMDIVLKGDIDGIETAAEIRNRYNIPIVYLTAYEDDKTLRRAKLTEPLGYILKPFEERYLRSSIEMALYKHKMEWKLKENERWLATILKSVGDAVVVTDKNGNIKFMNPVAESLTGWSFQEAIGKSVKDVFNIINEDTKTPIENPVTRVLRDNTILSRKNHTILISKTGKQISIDHSAAPMHDGEGNITGVVIIITDITDRRLAENALKESEKRYKNLFDHATDAIFVQSLTGDILSVNKEASKLLGYTKSEIYALKFSDVIHPAQNIKTDELNIILKDKGSHRFETQYMRKDRSVVDVEVSMRLIHLLDEEVIQIFVRDVTERKKSQKEINMLAHSVKSISECVSITDMNNKLIFVNEAFVKTYGYTKEELYGKSMNIIRSQRNPVEIYDEIFETTIKGVWQGELMNRTRDGEEFPVYLSTSLIKDEIGKPIAMIGVANDITDRKKLENALKSSERDYRGLFENAHDPIVIFRPDDEIILDVNQSACEVYGFKRSELIGSTLDTLTKDHISNKDYIKETIEKGKNLRFETIQYKKDGTPVLLEINAALVEYKGQKAIVSINRDITERKKALEALVKSEKRYQDLYDSAPDIYFSLISDGKIKSVNKFGAEYLGYSTENLLGVNIKTLLHKDDIKSFIEKFEKIFSDLIENSELDFKLVKEEGETIWVRMRIRLIFDEKGHPNELFIICRDITQSMLSEQILREREELYRAMFEKNMPVKFIIDPETGNVFDANKAACDYYGYDLETFKKKSLTDITLNSENLLKDLQYAKKEESSYFLYRHKLAKGDEREVEIYASPLDFKGKKVLFCIINDITERMTAEASIKESEQKYKRLAENAPIAVTRFAFKDKSYDFVNDEFVHQSGYSMTEFNMLSDKELLDMIYQEDREKIFSFYKTWETQGHKGTQHIDYRIINRFNKLVWLDTYLYAEFNEDGSTKAIHQVCIDITEQKKAQYELKTSEMRFRALIENSSDLIALVDSHATIQYASPSTTRILGYPLEEFIGKNGFDFIHPDDLPSVKNSFNTLLEKPRGSVHVIYRAKHKDGAWLWIEASGTNLLVDPSVGSIVINYRDITERKNAEEEIILQKSYFQQLFENSPEAIVLLDNQDKIVNVNKGFEMMFQYKLEEIKGKSINTVLVPENLVEQAAQMSLFILKGEIIHKESVRKRKDGSLVDVSVLGYPITLGNDQIGVYGIYSDISERKETEKALRTSEERYKAFVQQSTEGIWRFEFLEPIPMSMPVQQQIQRAFKYGYLAECNDLVAKMYGYESADEIVGVRLNELLLESEPKNFEYLKAFIESGYRLNDAESIEIDKEGNFKYFLNNFVGIIENNTIVRAWGTQRDITASKKAEDELRLSQFRLATLLMNLPDVVLYETGGGKEFISENVIDLLGYPADKIINDMNFFKSLMHPGDLKIVETSVSNWLKTGGKGILNQEYRCRKADGTYIWLEDHMIKVTGETKDYSIAGVRINVTDHKLSEDKLKKLAEKLQASNKELEQFAYVASHDLQEPLRMVASYIQLLQRRYKGKLGEEADEFINYAVDGVVRMKTLINDLLIYSRVNTQEFPKEATDINEILEQVKNNLRGSIEESNAEIVYEKQPVIYANHLQMTQLFQNLIGNAIKFRKPGEKPLINITFRKTNDEWLFSVIDNGIGIEKEFLERIFVIFQRLQNYNDIPGTGIGLAICKKILEKLGGHIWVESEPGKGSTFNFTIPLEEESSNQNI